MCYLETMSNSLSDFKILKKSISKILKWNHLLLYLKRRVGRELCLLLKAKSQNLINTGVRCLHKKKDVKKTVKRKICKVRVF